MKRHRKIINASLLWGLIAVAACNTHNEEKAPESTETITETTSVVPASISFDVVKEYPHDPSAFTEGLEVHGGFLYESTGQYGRSDLRKVEIATGKVLNQQKMDAQYFGEGMTILNGKIYQLTYREGKGFVYDLATLKQEKTFTFDAAEGWGMTNNGAQLIYDDGSNVLHYLDPATFKEVKRLSVTDEHGPVNAINELELINGFIYANVWQTDIIVKIDTTSGKVIGRVDMSSLHQRYNIPEASGRANVPDVLNGIAYDAATNKIYVTGKNWPKLFEVKLSQ